MAISGDYGGFRTSRLAEVATTMERRCLVTTKLLEVTGIPSSYVYKTSLPDGSLRSVCLQWKYSGGKPLADCTEHVPTYSYEWIQLGGRGRPRAPGYLGCSLQRGSSSTLVALVTTIINIMVLRNMYACP
jgi:hypothetical protein